MIPALRLSLRRRAVLSKLSYRELSSRFDTLKMAQVQTHTPNGNNIVAAAMNGHTPSPSLAKMDASISSSSSPESSSRSLAIPESEDAREIREEYRPFILSTEKPEDDWVNDLELDSVMDLMENQLRSPGGARLKVLVLYGSLRRRSYSRLVALEASRILFRLGCDVRVYNPTGLPMKNDVEHGHAKVQELRELSKWSDGHLWVSPEQHGNLTAVFKNPIDWIPLKTGSVRPTQGRTLAIAQVCGGSQSFNAVNSLRILGRWMRMFTIPNQSSIPRAYTHFPDEGTPGDHHLMASGNRERLVDCMEEFVRYTVLMRPHIEVFGDRFSERMERKVKEAETRIKEEELHKASAPSGAVAA